jgi:uncharacterized protein involved in exopolysaccharide biosynthesis
MTRTEALAVLRDLAFDLELGPAGADRLLERASQASEPELLRAALTELGARALLEETQEGRP